MAKRYLTLDIGASSVKLAEYEGGKGGLTLVNYGIAALAAPLDAGNAGALLSPALLEIVREKGIKPGPVAVSISGQMVFPRFASIAAAGGADKFDQMVRFEIEQNIPFPIDEMICDRQILGDNENGEKNVMIVAAKIDQVEDIAAAVRGAGFTPELVDVAPIAITNAKGEILQGDSESEINGIVKHTKWWENQDIMNKQTADGKPLIERRQGLMDRSKTIWALVNPNDYEQVAQ